MSIYSQYRAGLWHPYEKPMYGVLLNPYHPLARGLVGCWLFNEGGGNIVYDLSGHGNHGTLGGGTAGYCPAWTIGKFGSALNFDGSDDYVDVGTDESLDVAGGDFTVAVWARWTAATGNARAFLNFGFSGTSNRFLLTTGFGNSGQDKVSFGYGRSTTYGANWYYDAGSGLNDGDLHFVVATLFGSTVTIYVDDESVSFSEGSIGVEDGNFFGLGDNDYFEGDIETILIWKRALNPDEIWQLYTDPFCMFYHPLEAKLLYAAAPPAGIVPQAMHHYCMLREV